VIQDRRGSQLLEAAFVFGAFIFLMVGIFDFGQFLFLHESLVERARLGARYAIVHPAATDEEIRKVIMYDQSGGPPMYGLRTEYISVNDVHTADVQQRQVVISGYTYRVFSPNVGGLFTMRRIVAGYSVQ
jgi:hypothetical protein